MLIVGYVASKRKRMGGGREKVTIRFCTVCNHRDYSIIIQCIMSMILVLVLSFPLPCGDIYSDFLRVSISRVYCIQYRLYHTYSRETRMINKMKLSSSRCILYYTHFKQQSRTRIIKTGDTALQHNTKKYIHLCIYCILECTW